MQLEIIRPAEFIRVGAQGRFDLAASKTALAIVAAACRKRGIQHAVLDLRTLQPGPKPVFTTADLAELVNTFPEVGFTRRLRLAILYRSDPHKRARLFAFLSTLHGWSVRALGDLEQALLWFSRSDEPPGEARPQSGRVPAELAIPIRDSSSRRAGATIRAVSALRGPGDPLAGRRSVGSTASKSDTIAPSRKEVCERSHRP